MVALCADNTNTNFGGVKRRGQNNVWRRMQASLGKEIIGIGCGAHIVHNCLQTAVDCLPFDIESFAVKVYKYFHIYTVRTEELKDFCEFAGVEYAKLLEHGNTRFLSLGPAIDRILKIFGGLKSYFSSQEKCPAVLKQLFEDPCFELWLMFSSAQIQTFGEVILKIEKDNISATEVAWRIDSLKKLLQGRQTEGFIPTVVKKKLFSLQESGEVTQEHFIATVKTFFKNCVDYLQNWETSCGGAEKLQWVLLQTIPSWNEVQNSLASFSASQIKQITENPIEETKLFDQWQCVKEIVSENLPEWNRVAVDKTNVPVEERWKQIFHKMHSQNIQFDVILKVVEFTMCLPGTSAPVERVFSIMNNMWSTEKSRLHISTLSAMLMVKINFDHSCEEFYQILLKNKNILQKISSSQKYFWYEEASTSSSSIAGPSKP